MKLKTFAKVNTATNTRYIVFDGDAFVEDFTVNYLDEQTKSCKAVLKRISYEDRGAMIQHVDVYKGQLEVTIQMKGARK